MAGKSDRRQRRNTRGERKTHLSQADAEALALIKASGVLNPNVSLDQIMSLSEKLELKAQAAGHIFIFREVVLVECPD